MNLRSQKIQNPGKITCRGLEKQTYQSSSKAVKRHYAPNYCE
ncbi:hypothetical protein O59_002127 [Cellvibrio sp. BR]|nr:hypothetical protein O59_002127 [Cellvibrio sp. BR]